MTRTKTKTVDRKDRSEHISKPEHRAEHIKTDHSNQETTKADQTEKAEIKTDRNNQRADRYTPKQIVIF